MKILLKITLFILLTQSSFGQNDKWLRGFGTGIPDFVKAPIQSITLDDKSKPTEVLRDYSISLYSLSFENEINLYNFNKNHALGLHVAPRCRLSFGTGKTVSISVPTFLTYNIGLLSTPDTDKDNGFAIGLGVITQTTGLLPIQFIPRGEITNSKIQVFAQPGLYLAHRFWKGQKVHEIALQIGYFKHKNIEVYDYNETYNTYTPNHTYDGKNTSLTINLTFVKYFNY